MLSALLELVLGLILEIVVEILGQALIELGFHVIVNVFNRKRERNPLLAAIGYLIFGSICGLISLCILKESFIPNFYGQVVNLIITPVIAGLAMSEIGKLRLKKGQDLIRMDQFSYGFLFALGLVAVRFYVLNSLR